MSLNNVCKVVQQFSHGNQSFTASEIFLLIKANGAIQGVKINSFYFFEMIGEVEQNRAVRHTQ